MEFRKSVPRLIGLLFGAVALTVVCYFAATHATGYKMLVSWFGVAFFPLMFVLGLIQLFRSGPSIVMTAEGVSGPNVGPVPLKWTDLSAVSVGEMRRQKFLCLWPRDQEAYLAQLPPARRALAKANISMGFSAASLSFTALKPGLHDALDYALKHVPLKAG